MLNIPTTEERLGKSPQRLVRYFVLLMATIYLAMGISLWWTADTPSTGSIIQLGPTARRVLGSVFILYGLLRAWRGFQQFRTKKNPDNE